MSQLKSLLKQVGEIKSRIAGHDARLADLHTKLEAAKSAPIDYTKIDTDNQGQMIQLATRKLVVDILPAQIEQLDQTKGEAMRELAATAESLRRLIDELSAAEQQKLVTEIAGVLAPYSAPVPFGYHGQTKDPASEIASTLPIVKNVAYWATCNTRPVDEGTFPRERKFEIFDRDTLAFVDEVTGIAERYLRNGESFVPEVFGKKR